jgi:predicted RNA-binding protein YlxR (DUF448 family)
MPKDMLLRVVREPDGTVSPDAKGRAQGRGAYICPKTECVRAAMKKKAFSRVMKHPVGREVYEAIEAMCEPGGGKDA